MTRKPVLVGLLLAFLLPAPIAAAQSPETQAESATGFERRAAQLVEVLTGEIAFADYFDPGFQAELPEAQFKAMTASIIAQYGKPIATENAASTDGRSGSLSLRFEKGIAAVLLDVGSQRTQFSNDRLVSAVDMINTVDTRFALCT